MALQTYYSETLTKVGLKYSQDASSFVSGRVFPNCPVNLLSSTYPTYDKSYWFKNEAGVRAPGTESKGSPHARGTGSYACEDVSFHEDVPDEYIENDPEPLNPESAATRRVNDKINIYDEVDFNTRFFSAAIWANDVTPSTLWTAAGAGDPFADVDLGKRTMKAATGRDPNKLLLGRDVFDIMKRHSDVRDMVKYVSSEVTTAQLLARLFEVDEVLVMNGIYDSAAYGASASMDFIGGKHALLYYAPRTPSLEEPSAGYRFTWNGYGEGGYGVKNFALSKQSSRRVEAHSYRDMKLVATDLGYFLESVVA